ncbi:MAG: outer membrane beta-barrel protein [Proteobacteria bacterium]|nr:outer membrane beta-barrel protein [Pseudomonadota bacterium]
MSPTRLPSTRGCRVARARTRRAAALLAALLACLPVPAARGQEALPAADIATLFPAETHAAGTEAGVTVLSRARPLYALREVRLGLLEAAPRIDLGLSYDSDPTGLPHGAGGFVWHTAPSLTLGTGRGDDTIGIALGADDVRVPAVPAADRTDWTAAAGLRFGFGADRLTLDAAERALHEDGSEIGALPTDRPLPYRIIALRAGYRIGGARLSLIPALGFAAWRYDAARLGGVSVAQAYRDRDVVQGEVTARYALAPRRDLLLVLRGTQSHYVAPQPGAPSRDSTGFAALIGAEAGDGILHLRILAGWEQRDFIAAAYGTHAAPVAEAQAVWQPGGMTTVTATLSRRIEDAAQEGVAGYTETQAGLRVDREVRRDLLVSVAAGMQRAAFTNGGGRETGTSFGASATWLLNRRMRITAAETVTALAGAASTATSASGSVTRSVSLLTLGFGL